MKLLPEYAPGSVQTLLPLEDIADSVIHLRGGGCRAVLEAQSISFSLRSPAEQEAIVAGYRACLNSLSYPLQIVVRILPTDIERYLAALQARMAGEQSQVLRRLALDHEAFLRQLAKTTALLERRFYVVIPSDSESAGNGPTWPWQTRTPLQSRSPAADRQLSFRCDEVIQGFATFGVDCRRLTTEELAQLCASFLERDVPSGPVGAPVALMRSAPEVIHHA